MLNLQLYAAPTIEPIKIEELMLHSRLTDDDAGEEAALLLTLAKAAREQVEAITRRAILTQTWDYYLDGFPGSDRIKLPLGNLQSVTHVKYTDSAGTQTTMTATTEYLVETNGDQCGAIVLPYGESWPTFTEYPSNPVVIRFIAGWTTAALVPSSIKTAIMMIALDYYENREAQVLANAIMDYRTNRAVASLLGAQQLWDEF
jgi:uncharacterized phiE125 gp8 family phage protein